MSAANSGASAKITGKDVFIHNGRNGKWDLEENGFTLLTGQPFALTPEVLEENPAVFFGKALLFRLDKEEVEILGAEDVAPEQRQFLPYYTDIAKAAKEAYPEAEYVSIGGHMSFDADASRATAIKVLLGGACWGGAMKLLGKIFPSCAPQAEPAEKQVFKLPKFGALKDDAPHVDMSAEDQIKSMRSALNDAQPIKAGRLELPDGILSGSGVERRVVNCNFWRNARQDVAIKDRHLTFLDTQSVTEEELAQTKFKNYAIGGQEQHMMWKLKEQHKLVYFPDMTHDEIVLFKQGEYKLRRASPRSEYDVLPAADQHLHQVFHTAFSDASAPKDAAPRRAIVCPGVKIFMHEASIRPLASKN